MAEQWTWLGIAFCLSQSAMFSGLNLAFFSLSRLDLEIEAKTDRRARRVLQMRRDSNRLLTTILWGNVGINVLLTLLTDSVMAGALAFLVSTALITFFGEIVPQAYFSRNALRMASLLAPVLRAYRFLLYPVAYPCARMLDWWLGKEAPSYFREGAVRELLLRHMRARGTDVSRVEGRGAVNFLDLDDRRVDEIAEPLDESSVLALPVELDLPRFPPMSGADSEFLRRLGAVRGDWAVVTDPDGVPRVVVDVSGFVRGALYDEDFDPYAYCRRPTVLSKGGHSVAYAIRAMTRDDGGDDGADVVLVWGESPALLTGDIILRNLLKGI